MNICGWRRVKKKFNYKKAISIFMKVVFHLMLAFILLITFYLISQAIDSYFTAFNGKMPSSKVVEAARANWGVFGDYFGGVVNPLLGFISFIALIYTIYVQIMQSKDNAKTQAIQQFEGFFAYLAAELRDIYKGLDDETKNVQSYLDVGREKFPLKNKLRTDFELVRFFMYLYQVLKHIHNLDDKFFEFEDKKRYSNIIRAGLSNEILQLIYLNCVDFGKPEIDDFQEYKKLITEFSFLEHMTFKVDEDESYNYSLVYYSQFFDNKVFGNSYYLKEIENGFYTKKIKSDSIPYLSEIMFINEILPIEGIYFVNKLTDEFKSMYISFETNNQVKLYDFQQKVSKSDFLKKNLVPLLVFMKGNDFFISELHLNSIKFKTFISNNEVRQLSLSFTKNENGDFTSAEYAKIINNVETIYCQGVLEKI